MIHQLRLLAYLAGMFALLVFVSGAAEEDVHTATLITQRLRQKLWLMDDNCAWGEPGALPDGEWASNGFGVCGKLGTFALRQPNRQIKTLTVSWGCESNHDSNTKMLSGIKIVYMDDKEDATGSFDCGDSRTVTFQLGETIKGYIILGQNPYNHMISHIRFQTNKQTFSAGWTGDANIEISADGKLLMGFWGAKGTIFGKPQIANLGVYLLDSCVWGKPGALSNGESASRELYGLCGAGGTLFAFHTPNEQIKSLTVSWGCQSNHDSNTKMLSGIKIVYMNAKEDVTGSLDCGDSQTITFQLGERISGDITLGQNPHNSMVSHIHFQTNMQTFSAGWTGDANYTFSADGKFLMGFWGAQGTIFGKPQIANLGMYVASPFYRIDLVNFGASVTQAQQLAFQHAAAKWTTVISDLEQVVKIPKGTRCDNYVFPADTLVQDLLIVYEMVALEKDVLGEAGPCLFENDGPKRPRVGIMRFDPIKNKDAGFESVVLHEMGHVIGIGTKDWEAGKLVNSDFTYAGTNGNEANQRLGLSGPALVEDTMGPGSKGSHWRERVYGDELMTPIASADGAPMPMSILTVSSLQDIGYVVNVEKADPYHVPNKQHLRGSVNSLPEPDTIKCEVLHLPMQVVQGV